ncbi:hypothetical protein DCS_07054 [Drechmeria coniospora]|uniref:F-box domain-containing protein n=1 Tax=Drechmeria coniospora TaxID=98403 RepID=A0A151GDA2_DRECN|nr:hypothetical protein DCS_07054 [Drechmeria coniospora]KYK55092.1 hypothetical protein DCS_07054 [Drechmeria coniospora]
MVSTSLSHAPVELLHQILSYAATPRDVLSFALTCRHMWEAWQCRHAGLRTAWRLSATEIPAAEQALIAHRASQVVLDAERHAKRPPRNIDLAGLSSTRRHVDPSELLAVRQLHLLAGALEKRFYLGSKSALPEDVHGLDTPEPADRMAEWRVNMHKAIYRSIITGAALAGVYKEPWVQAGAREDLKLKPYSEFTGEKHEDFLDTFPVLRFETTEEEQEAAFGVYGEWLLKELRRDVHAKAIMAQRFATCSGRARSCHEREHQEPQDGEGGGREACPVQLVDGGSHSDAHAVVLELMRLLWACCCVVGVLSAFQEKECRDPATCVPIVPWGRFSSWLVTITPPKGHDVPRFKTERPDGVGSEVDDSWWVTARFAGMDNQDPIEDTDIYPPFIEAKFFVYFLRRHMKLAFHDNFFHPDEGAEINDNWLQFMDSLLIFSLDDVGDRDAYYPEYASMELFPDNGFLDGGDLLVSWDALEARKAALQ